MAKLTNTEFQAEFDLKKWIDSEKAGKDTCGDYDFCSFCDKTKPTPCAKAYTQSQKPAEAKKPQAKATKAAPKTAAKKTTKK